MLSEGDKAIINETAWSVGKQIAEEIKKDTRIQIRLHAAECPVAKKVEKTSNQFLGGWKTIVAVATVVMAVAGLLIHFVK